jgi:threonine dehydratase
MLAARIEHAAEIRGAAERIAAHVRRTPLLPADFHDGLLVKPECLQVNGSFKTRGACNAVARLSGQSPRPKGVITHSSGNHATAVAYAARRFGLPATVVIPSSASPNKIAAARHLGAEVVTAGVTFDNREQVAEDLAGSSGLHLVHPYDDWDIIHGAATSGLEILEDAPRVGCVVAPIGGGGQVAGLALAIDSFGPRIQVFGVEPELANDAARSFAAGELKSLESDPSTIAEGVKSKSIGQRNFEVIVRRRLVAGIVTVSEQELEYAIRTAWSAMHLAVEPTGALALAAWLQRRVPLGTRERPTVLVLSGGNFDPRQTARILLGGAA